MLFADMFYRVAHHHETGQPYAHPSAVSTGCAAALLAELLPSRHIDITAGKLSTIFSAKPPASALTHTILDTITGEPEQHPLKMWLRFLGRTSTAQVAERLTRHGETTEQTFRTLVVRKSTLHVPVNPGSWEGTRAYLYTCLATERLPSWEMAWLLGIVLGTGLHHHLLDGAPESAHQHLAWIASQLPPAVQELVNAATAATGEAVTTRR